jgi:hypothetical protein
MIDLNQPLAHHAATYPAEAIGAELAANLSRNLTDGLAAIISGWNAPGVDEAARLVIESARPANSRLFVHGGSCARFRRYARCGRRHACRRIGA